MDPFQDHGLGLLPRLWCARDPNFPLPFPGVGRYLVALEHLHHRSGRLTDLDHCLASAADDPPRFPMQHPKLIGRTLFDASKRSRTILQHGTIQRFGEGDLFQYKFLTMCLVLLGASDQEPARALVHVNSGVGGLLDVSDQLALVSEKEEHLARQDVDSEDLGRKPSVGMAVLEHDAIIVFAKVDPLQDLLHGNLPLRHRTFQLDIALCCLGIHVLRRLDEDLATSEILYVT
mmetsp:Transcript_13010/g.29692  ORF Transcript_13010/g.29692 Transcript_13010/m.29692 type:complete len:232 (-) Transcript_13010:603-1298(-)